MNTEKWWSEEKHKETLDLIYEKNYGRKLSESVEHNICVLCGNEANELYIGEARWRNVLFP
jgi:hypothetical protein